MLHPVFDRLCVPCFASHDGFEKAFLCVASKLFSLVAPERQKNKAYGQFYEVYYIKTSYVC